MSVNVIDLVKTFANFKALNHVSLKIHGGEFCALLGPSGSGKTTLLRIIAGLEFPDSGTVTFGGQDVLHKNTRDRGVGFVFQHYALFRHMTVFENVAFGLRVRPKGLRPDDAEIAKRVNELLTLVQLDIFANRYPSQLSGGQRQRVALARALAIEPKILLLDEPFGALDAKVRRELRKWLRELHERLGLTSIFVTHDQEEALELADRVVVMSNGQIEQIGSPHDIYDNPETPFVYSFLGNANKLPVVIKGGKAFVDDQYVPLPAGRHSPHHDGDGTMFVRGHDLAISMDTGQPGLPAHVTAVINAGPLIRLELISEPAGRALNVELSRNLFDPLLMSIGRKVTLTPVKFGLFDAQNRLM